MKSFIFALFLLLCITLFVTVNARQTVNSIDKMLDIANSLPKYAEEFALAGHIEDDVFALISLWDREFPLLVFTAGYTNTNRCDEAIGALAVYFQNKNGPDFTVALSEFCDSLSRLRILEGMGWEGIL